MAGGWAGLQVADVESGEALASLEAGVVEAVAVGAAVVCAGMGDRIAIAGFGADGSLSPGGVYAPLRHGRRIIVRDGVGFVADLDGGLKAYSLADPTRPLLFYGDTAHIAHDLALGERYLFLGTEGGLLVYDIGIMLEPESVAELGLPGPALGLDVAGTWIAVAMGDAGLGLVNVLHPDNPILTGIAPLGGIAYDVAVTDDGWAYVAVGADPDAGDDSWSGLALVNLFGEGGPELYSTLALPGDALAVDVEGSTVYVAAGEEGMHVVDVLRPATPRLVGHLLPESGHTFEDVEVAGKRAYLADGRGVVIADVDVPGRPVALSHVDGQSEGVALADETIFAVGGPELIAADVSFSSEPVPLGRHMAPERISDLRVEGGLLYAANSGEGPAIIVLDLSDPRRPIEVAYAGDGGHAVAVAPAGDILYLAEGRGGVSAWRLADDLLTLRGRYRPFLEASRISLNGETALIGGGSGWALVDISAPEMPVPLAHGGAKWPAQAVAVGVDRVYVAAHEEGVLAYDMADLSAPVGVYGTPGAAASLALDGELLYVADSSGTLTVLDAERMRRVAGVSLPGRPADMAFADGFAYLALEGGSLAVVDLRSPTAGVARAGTLSLEADDMATFSGTSLAYAISGRQLAILDISALPNVAQVGAVELPQPASSIYIDGSRLYALDPGVRVQVIGLADPYHPVAIGLVDTGAVDMVADGSALYLAEGENGLRVVDISSLDSPVELASMPDLASVTTISIVGDLLIAGGDSLHLVDISDPGDPHRLASVPLDGVARDVVALPAPDGVLMAYVADGGGLDIFLASGGTLTLPSRLRTSWPAERIAICGERAFVASGGEIVVADLPEGDGEMAALMAYQAHVGGDPVDLEPVGDYLLSLWEGGLEVIDVGHPEPPPQVIGQLDGINGEPEHVWAGDNLVWIGAGEAGVYAVDVSEPGMPVISRHLDVIGSAYRAVPAGDTLFIAAGECGLRVLDISDPDSQREIGYWRSGFAGDVAVDAGGLVYLADINELRILHYDPTGGPVYPPVPTSPSPPDGAEGTGTDLTLRWEPRGDKCNPLRYEVTIWPDEGDPVSHTTDVPEYRLTGLEPDSAYAWQIRVIDAQGDASTGSVWTFRTSYALPPTFWPAWPTIGPPTPVPQPVEPPSEGNTSPWMPVFGLAALALVGIAAWLWLRRRMERD